MADERQKKGPVSFKLGASTVEALDELAAPLGGNRTAALEQAVHCWSGTLTRAAADNEAAFTRAEWCLIADVCNGTLWEPGVRNPAVMLAAEVEDGHRLDGAGYRWLGDEGTELAGSLAKVAGGKPTRGTQAVDRQVTDLVKRLAALDYAHAWAVVVAVCWFWSHADDIDPREDPWWTVAFRRRLERGEKE